MKSIIEVELVKILLVPDPRFIRNRNDTLDLQLAGGNQSVIENAIIKIKATHDSVQHGFQLLIVGHGNLSYFRQAN